MSEKQLTGLLGLAYRAGNLVAGADKALDYVRQGKAVLVLLDAGTAVNTRKKLADSCANRGIDLLEAPKGLLGQAIGRPGVNVAAARPGGLTEKLQAMMTGGDTAPAEEKNLEGTELNG
ncbi:MAG: ribosomal L7Ae/L30e/S12e/Gadd45 family protein [Eubacteriales bacterium]|nr:ribosomal L7Ae/L30e/S12e/Gadd45 family protein [Eubacteriales bacterium]